MKVKFVLASLLFSITMVFGFDFGSITKKIGQIKDTAMSHSPMKSMQSNKSLPNPTVTKGLKEALRQGVNYAVVALGKKNGYLNNKDAKIDLPPSLRTLSVPIKAVGGSKLIDDLVVSMNKAATKAAPKTAKIFLRAIDKMSIDDAQNILANGDEAATLYFQQHTTEDLKKMIKPIVQESMRENSVATYYDTLNSFYKTNVKGYVENSSVGQMAKSYGLDKFLPKNSDVSIDDYVTNSAIEGLFKLIAQKEKDIRTNPAAQTTSLLQKVFGK